MQRTREQAWGEGGKTYAASWAMSGMGAGGGMGDVRGGRGVMGRRSEEDGR
jgi:hypothetical protein